MAVMFRTCIEVKTDGIQCGSPALRNNLRCHWHAGRHVSRVLNSRAYQESVLHSEGRLHTINHIVQALLNGKIDSKSAHSALYAVQIASELPCSQDFGDKLPVFKILPGFDNATE